jgi:hypothetical protein
MQLTTKLIGFLNRVFLRDPKSTLAFQLFYDGAMTWRVADGILTINVVGGSGISHVIDLSRFTIDTLCIFLDGQLGFNVTSENFEVFGTLSALVLVDATGDQAVTGGHDFNGYTSLVWAWMDAAANELRTASIQSGEALRQMSVPTANDNWLDVHGNFYDTPRLSGELDAAYGPRIIANVIQAKGNNVAIEAALAIAFNAVSVEIDDYNVITVAGDGTKSYGLFDADIAVPLGSPVDITVDQSARSIIDKFRDAGTHLRLLTLTVVSDLVIDNLIVLSVGNVVQINYLIDPSLRFGFAQASPSVVGFGQAVFYLEP